MKSLLRMIRYSSIGVFFAGIVSVLAGCTEREGILGIVLLILLQFCSGPVADTAVIEPSPTGTLPILDLFTVSESFSVPCIDDVTSRSTAATESAAFNTREITTNGFFGDSNQVDVTVGGGTISISLAANPNGNFCQVLFDYPGLGEEGPAFDASSFARLQFDVVSHTQVNGDVICQTTVDITKSGITTYIDGLRFNTNGIHYLGFLIYPLPADTTSMRFVCQLDPGEAVEVRDVKLVGTLIDDHSVNNSRSNQSCQSGNTRDAAITNYFKDIDRRTLTAGSPTATGTSNMSFLMTNVFSTILFSSGGGTGCDYPNSVTQGALVTWYDDGNDDNTDFSQVDSVRIAYNFLIGSVTDCFLAVHDSAGNIIESDGPFALTTPPIAEFNEIILPLSGAPALASANTITLYGCSFGANGSLQITSPHVLP